MSEPDYNQSLNKDFQPHWSDYYKAVEGRPPRDTLLAALNRFEAAPAVEHPRFAVDLGCGEGRDTIEILRRGWRVLGIDSNPEAIERLLGRDDLPNSEQLQTCVAKFEEAEWPEADLINASFCLPFCSPESFPPLWSKIVDSLVPRGRFSGQLFGERDSWATICGRTHHTRAQVEAMLQAFEIEMLNEEEHDGVTAVGQPKYWHIFHIVACKR